MPVQDIINTAKAGMAKAVEHFQQQLVKVRTGRASATMLDNLRIDYYGTPTPISQVGSVSVPEPRLIIVQPWERNMLGPIEKAIQASDLNVNPNNDGTVIRIPIPPLTEERRKDIVKNCWKMAEEAKVAIRSVRRDDMEALKRAEKAEGFSEDDRKRGEDELQKLTDKFVKDIDALAQKKEAEILEV
ncbi:MAG: ribosome recycling factor [Candidatus Kapabacteria bacterium]|nr:ribosome recycling factor [Candidatus Kapabacteria bacterium]MBX7153636.1 ribosome recycling factor [Bacteroidota bacterium]